MVNPPHGLNPVFAGESVKLSPVRYSIVPHGVSEGEAEFGRDVKEDADFFASRRIFAELTGITKND